MCVQYFLKVEDTEVEKYLKLFTMLPLQEIKQIMEAHQVCVILNFLIPHFSYVSKLLPGST